MNKELIIDRAMILCAGLGKRLKPFTNEHPKALAMVNNKSLLQRNIEYLQGIGIRRVIINVHHFAGEIIDTIEKNNDWGTTITISDETAAVLETGGGLKKAQSYLQQSASFVLMNVDILTNLDLNELVNDHLTHKPLATLATTNRETSRYFLFNQRDILCGWCNTKTGEEKIIRHEKPLFRRAFSGIHVISSSIFPLIKRKGKFSMVDLYLDLAKENIIRSFDHSSSKFIDVGTPESMIKAAKMFK